MADGNDQHSDTRVKNLAILSHKRTRIKGTRARDKRLVDDEILDTAPIEGLDLVSLDINEISTSLGRECPPIHEVDTVSQTRLYTPKKDFSRKVHLRGDLDETQVIKDSARIVHSPFFRIMGGKTQLFPISEHALVRNRLTHSLEVTDIAQRIAAKINSDCDYFSQGGNALNMNVISCAALAHDIGHPPFAHAGEECLAKLMQDFGGFESNAQTLRILTRLERRLTSQASEDGAFSDRQGLNLTLRTLASVLKYDQVLFIQSPNRKTRQNASDKYRETQSGHLLARKGYYREEANFVENMKNELLIDPSSALYTIECSVMDLADDIAYSTYDLEDAMVVGLLHPFDIASLSHLHGTGDLVLQRVNDKLYELGFARGLQEQEFTRFLYGIAAQSTSGVAEDYDFSNPYDRTDFALQCFLESKEIARDRAMRRSFAENRISRAINSITVEFNADEPKLSRASLQNRELIETLILKEHNYERVISSGQLRVFEKKVFKLIEVVFEAIEDGLLDSLLPAYIRNPDSGLYLQGDPHWRKRMACDVISAMSERDVSVAYEALTTSRDLRATDLQLVW